MAAQWSPAFSSYDSDLWTYLLIVERVADGQDVLAHEPFHLEPPAGPHVSVVWLALGHLQRWSGLSSLVLARGAALASIVLLCASAFSLARRLGGGGSFPALALPLFWLSLSETWSAVVLGRYMSLAFVALAAATALSLSKEPRAILRTAAFVGLGFYAHLFGGVLAAAAVLVVAAARGRRGEGPRAKDVLAALALGAVLAAPCLGYALTTAGLARTSAHTWRPEQVEAFGLRWMRPDQLLDLLPVSVLALAVLGLVVRVPGERRLAQEVARVGTLVAALLLFSPLYHLATSWFGGWMVGRFVALAFPWLAATIGLDWTLREGGGRWWLGAGGAALVAVLAQGAARVVSDWRDDAYALTAPARDEAFFLRRTLRGRTYVTPSPIGYGLAAPTLGRPLAVPPGHASPFGDFRRQERRVHRALAANTEECWAAFVGLYPEVAFLLTPAPGATVERRIWRERIPETSPEAVRALLASRGALDPVHAGPVFVLDALRTAPLGGPRDARGGGMGRGRHCGAGGEEP